MKFTLWAGTIQVPCDKIVCVRKNSLDHN